MKGRRPPTGRWPVSLVAALLLVGSGCSKAHTPSGSPLSLPALKLTLLDALGGHLVTCGVAEFPVHRSARTRLRMARARPTAFAAILRHLGLSAGQSFTGKERRAILEDYSHLQEIYLDREGRKLAGGWDSLRPAGDGYIFDITVPQGGSRDVGLGEAPEWRVTGMITRSGAMAITDRDDGPWPVGCAI